MAYSIQTSANAVHPFQKFCIQISLDLLSRDVELLKFLTSKYQLPENDLEVVNTKEENSGLRWLSCLIKRNIIWDDNLKFLIEALETVNRHDLAEKARKYQQTANTQQRELFQRTGTLVCRPSSAVPYYLSDTLHLSLAVDLGCSTPTSTCKHMIHTNKKALNIYNKENSTVNLKLALIKFGDHDDINPFLPYTRGQESDVAILVHGFSEDLNIMRNLKCYEYCGGSGGSCGLADALAMFVDLLQESEVQQKVPKLCILICFISKKSSNLEHFRCPGGNDAIKLCHLLAEHAVPLYIIGIDLASVQASARGMPQDTEVNNFLKGITLIGGGQYIQVSVIDHVKQVIQWIIKENTSIENHMGKVDDIIIIERNRLDGDLNVDHLAQHLEKQLNIRSCTVDRIKTIEHHVPIPPIAERIAWADDLDDAIQAVQSWKQQQEVVERPQVKYELQPRNGDLTSFSSVRNENEQNLHIAQFQEQTSQSHFSSTGYINNKPFNTLGTKRSVEPNALSVEPKRHLVHRQFINGFQSTNSKGCEITLAQNQRVNGEVAKRMVMRQITRKAYYQINH